MSGEIVLSNTLQCLHKDDGENGRANAERNKGPGLEKAVSTEQKPKNGDNKHTTGQLRVAGHQIQPVYGNIAGGREKIVCLRRNKLRAKFSEEE